ncbi:Rhodanese-related sulfurtransferase [Singulisphaera sp. GP187]|uniref:rhodanese-like domain-containing protein n=1 Tax=Singulisphaera sp. GP187 TaxID=1882752 RepID=UPI00092B0310|nr:rhodanese-like domain-containing protein [Singulisphaera sp. GP187]SIN71314.1 Rhodanese-related sulfurtransferase [Singulisphaera sp. GP187]
MRHVFALAVALVLGAGTVQAADPTYPDITHDELVTAVEAKKVTLLDANGTDSYKAGHIPTAIDFEKAEKDLAAKLPADKSSLIVAYCANERCTAYRSAARVAKELGYTNIKHYSKGIFGWKAAGATVETAK